MMHLANVDDGYIGEHTWYIKSLKGFTNPEETFFMQQRIRNHQETVDKRLKQLGILKHRYRYNIPKYGDVLCACAILTQFALDDGDTLLACGYWGIQKPIGREK